MFGCGEGGGQESGRQGRAAHLRFREEAWYRRCKSHIKSLSGFFLLFVNYFATFFFFLRGVEGGPEFKMQVSLFEGRQTVIGSRVLNNPEVRTIKSDNLLQ